MLLTGAGILAVLLLLDILTTGIILRGGGFEYNPFMAGIVQHPLVHAGIKMLLLVLVLLTARYSEANLKGSGTLLFAAVIGLYLLCDVNNLESIVRAGVIV